MTYVKPPTTDTVRAAATTGHKITPEEFNAWLFEVEVDARAEGRDQGRADGYAQAVDEWAESL